MKNLSRKCLKASIIKVLSLILVLVNPQMRKFLLI